MRAAVITRPGGPEVLDVEQRPTPIPRASEVLVRVRASALNRADLAQRQGHYPAPPGSPADIPGLEFAGEIEAVGEDAHGWREGDRVFGITGGGGNAEYLVADAWTLARVPERLSWTEAAAVPEAFMTAYDSLVTQARVQRNETVLVHAVGSGVGLAGTQLARAWSATPFGTARAAEKIERAREYGLADGVALADDPEAFVTHAERWTNGAGIDVTLDLVGGAYVPADVRAAATRGRIMIIGTVAGAMATVPIGMVLRKRLTLRGTALRSRTLEEKRAVAQAFVRDVVPLFETGALRPTIDQVFELEQIRAAHERLASNATFGKVVLRVP
ncbi:MAG TPA: NAD(P)H-quinone oxidoreductase [Gemmatimonadaceae bacterium]|nr:NAD(P)H-quinone oxidoreductase [Gemmatimonadaceae bacterium]